MAGEPRLPLIERRRLCLLLLLGALLCPPAAFGAAPADRASARASYESVLHDESVAAGWTGAVDTCTVGTESSASIGATLHTVNVLRAFAGLGPITFDAQKNQRALAAALMMRAANALSHDPGPTWPCYSANGALGANTSNLFLGESGAAAMVGYVEDGGVSSLGHRRWVIDPDAEVFGSGSTGTTNALTVIGNAGDGQRAARVPANSVVSWPPKGEVPWPWVFSDWSASIGNDNTQGQVSLANAQVSVSVDGTKVPVSNIQDLGTGFGTGDTLSWSVAIPASMQAADNRINVSISGVTLGGNPLPVSYTVDAFNPAVNEPPPPGGPTAACKRAKAKLRSAKHRLAHARAHGTRKAVKAARKLVHKRRHQARRACRASAR